MAKVGNKSSKKEEHLLTFKLQVEYLDKYGTTRQAKYEFATRERRAEKLQELQATFDLTAIRETERPTKQGV